MFRARTRAAARHAGKNDRRHHRARHGGRRRRGGRHRRHRRPRPQARRPGLRDRRRPRQPRRRQPVPQLPALLARHRRERDVQRPGRHRQRDRPGHRRHALRDRRHHPLDHPGRRPLLHQPGGRGVRAQRRARRSGLAPRRHRRRAALRRRRAVQRERPRRPAPSRSPPPRPSASSAPRRRRSWSTAARSRCAGRDLLADRRRHHHRRRRRRDQFGGFAGLVLASAGTVQLAALDGPGTVALAGAEVAAERLGRIELRRQGALLASGDGAGRSRCARASCGSRAMRWSPTTTSAASAPRGAHRDRRRPASTCASTAPCSASRAAPATPHRSRSRPGASRPGQRHRGGHGLRLAERRGASGDAGAVTIRADRLVLAGRRRAGQRRCLRHGRWRPDPGRGRARRDPRRRPRPGGRDHELGAERDQRQLGLIRVVADTLLLTDGGRIQAQTFGLGRGGAILLEADGSSSRATSPACPSAVDSSSRGAGRGGDIVVRAETLQIEQGGLAATAAGGGRAGSIDIESTTAEPRARHGDRQRQHRRDPRVDPGPRRQRAHRRRPA